MNPSKRNKAVALRRRFDTSPFEQYHQLSLLTGLLDSTQVGNFITVFLITVLAAGGAAVISSGLHHSPPQKLSASKKGKAE